MPPELVLILKYTTLEKKEAEGLEGTELNPHFPQNFGTSTNSHATVSVVSVKNTQQCAFTTQYKDHTNMHPTVWKLIPLLMKEDISGKKKKCDAK